LKFQFARTFFALICESNSGNKQNPIVVTTAHIMVKPHSPDR